MRRLASLLLTALLPLALAARSALAEVPIKRTLSVEWEPVPDSLGYELEVARVLKNGSRRKPLFFKTKKAAWKGSVSAGRYEVRLRSADERGVFGDWSPPIEVWARLPEPEVTGPVADTEIKARNEEKETVAFTWTPVTGAAGYWLEIKDSNDREVFSGPLTASRHAIDLPVAQRYTWRVATIMPEEERPALEERPTQNFALLGPALAPPKIRNPNTKFVTQLEWDKPNYAMTYAYKLERQTAKGWQKLESADDVSSINLNLNPDYPGGNWRITVHAKAPLRLSSPRAQLEFKVYEGSRTPAAIEQAKLREAIEKERDSLFLASYLISSIDYQGRNRESGRAAEFAALTGTGRLGYGYIPNKSKWGLLSFVDLSGVVIRQKNYLFYSAEAQAVYRKYLSSFTQLRVYGGGYLRQLPEAVELANDQIKVNEVATAGPHAGFQLWHPITYKVGIQTNAQVLYSFYGIKTPNGNDINPSLSYQVGLLGSYKLKENVTSFAGYAYRVDTIQYKAKPFDGTDLGNFAKPGDINEVAIKGHYLNLFLEWGF